MNLLELMHLIYKSKARHVTVILDCCFSGKLWRNCDARRQWNRFESEFSLIRDNVTLLAASTSSQTASAGSPYSAFTERLIDGLSGAAADSSGHITAPGLSALRPPVSLRPINAR